MSQKKYKVMIGSSDVNLALIKGKSRSNCSLMVILNIDKKNIDLVRSSDANFASINGESVLNCSSIVILNRDALYIETTGAFKSISINL